MDTVGEDEELVNLEKPLVSTNDKPESEYNFTRLFARSGCIVVTEMCERMTAASIDANLMILLQTVLSLNPGTASTVSLIWKGTNQISTLFFAYLADSLIGRFKTILFGSFFYLAFVVLLAVSVMPSMVESYSWVCFLALFAVGLLTSSIKTNAIVFGADQFSDVPNKEKKEVYQQSFFNWYYALINLGGIVTYTIISYVQQEISFSIGLAIPAGIMALAIIFFLIGIRWYIVHPPSGSILSIIIKVVYYAWKAPPETKMESFFDGAKSALDESGARLFTDVQVDDVRDFFRPLPILFFLGFLWLDFGQFGSVMFIQGTALDLSMGGFTIPVAALNVFNLGAVFLLVPLFERIIYPQLRKRNIRLSMLTRIGLGLLIANLCMFYVGGLEVYRLSLFFQGETFKQRIGPSNYVTAVKLSVFTQVPAFVVGSVAEILAAITALEFCYTQAPASMRSIVLSIYYLNMAIGLYIGSAIVAIINAVTNPKWINESINHSRMDLYFFTLTALGFINFFGYVFVAKYYKLKPQSEEEKQPNGDQ